MAHTHFPLLALLRHSLFSLAACASLASALSFSSIEHVCVPSPFRTASELRLIVRGGTASALEVSGETWERREGSS